MTNHPRSGAGIYYNTLTHTHIERKEGEEGEGRTRNEGRGGGNTSSCEESQQHTTGNNSWTRVSV